MKTRRSRFLQVRCSRITYLVVKFTMNDDRIKGRASKMVSYAKLFVDHEQVTRMAIGDYSKAEVTLVQFDGICFIESVEFYGEEKPSGSGSENQRER